MATSSRRLSKSQKQNQKQYLFGGDRPWSPLDWTASDDRVRGGSSISHLDCPPAPSPAVFRGTLDYETLGGAGFASQRTTERSVPGDGRWQLSDYDGILLEVALADGKQYTFIVKDEELPKRPDGREQSTISWEYDFTIDQSDTAGTPAPVKLFISWRDFKPTYRGRPKEDAPPLNLASIKRFCIMVRSFFGSQQGDFSLSIRSIAATTKPVAHAEILSAPRVNDSISENRSLEKVSLDNARKSRGCCESCIIQ